MSDSDSPYRGLSSQEVEKRFEEGKSNKLQADAGNGVLKILSQNLFTFFNLLNLVLGICLLAARSYRNMGFMIGVVVNIIIGTVQELRARATIRKLKLLNISETSVLRDGQEIKIPSDELVLDDVVILRGGDQVPADAQVLEGVGAANEALLTGESDAVQKTAGDSLLSGSYISEGRFVARLTKVGDESYAAKLTHSAKKIKRAKSELMAELSRLIHMISAFLIPVGILLFLKQYFLDGLSGEDSIAKSVAAVIGMIPEGLVLLTSVAMALGVIRLGQRQTLVQELSGIETLARADVLCLDKTGTLTTGNMVSERFEGLDCDEDRLKEYFADFLSAFDESTGTLNALKAGVGERSSAKTVTAVLPFSSQRKKSAVTFSNGTTLVLGAPSFVLSDGVPETLSHKVMEYTENGKRVLLLAECAGSIQHNETPPVTRLLGLAVLADELRPNVRETMRYFVEQDVKLKIISGDDPKTASIIAARAGVPNSDRLIDATELASEEQILDAAERYTVFGRVTPDQKKQLVQALKAHGHNVAMTGDGVNDIPALKTADCSIAMAGGSDATRQVAQLTLLNSDFSSMPEIVAEGRRVIANITRSAMLFLTKTLYSFCLALLTLAAFFLHLKYPFSPIQLTLVGTLFIGVPSFILALEPNRERSSGGFLQKVLLNAAPGAAAVTVCALIAMLCEQWGYSDELCSTLATLSTGFMSMITMVRVALPLNFIRLVLVLVTSLLFLLAGGLFGDFFYFVPLEGVQWLVLIGLCACGCVVMAIGTQVKQGLKIIRRN